ncbi:MAG TPA: transcription elongation factor GreB [Polyangiaceae bacterium]
MPNYLTPDGAKRLSFELDQLMRIERPRVVQEVTDAAAQGDRSENAEYIYGKKRLREIDRRVRFLTKRLESAVIVRPGEVGGNLVRFGATVELRDENGKESRYLLVGPDEANPTSGKLSFQAPLGRALMNKKVGDVVVVQRPLGEIDVEIISISYDGESELADAKAVDSELDDTPDDGDPDDNEP